MNILLVQPHYNFPVSYVECPSGALILLGTIAENAGHKVKVLHLDADEVDLRQELMAFKPDILGITVDTFHTRSAKVVSKLAKEVSKDIFVTIGGPHPSALKEECFAEFPEADAIVHGEGEFGFMELIEGKPEPPNCLMGGNGLKPTVYSADLDHIPLPDYDLVDIHRFSGFIVPGPQPIFYIMASRGCPFRCTFCGSSSIWERKVRLRKPEMVVDEAEYLINKYGAREIFFTDDTFNSKLPWTMEILSLLIGRGLNQKCIFRITCRADQKLITEEFLKLAKEAGVWLIFYGVESGNQQLVDSMNKGLNLNDVRRAFKLTNEAGIKIQASFILGMPGETKETIEDTKWFIQETKPDYYGCSLATPFPGTELERQVKLKGHLFETDYENYGMGFSLVRTDTLSRAELGAIHKEMEMGVGRHWTEEEYKSIMTALVKQYVPEQEDYFIGHFPRFWAQVQMIDKHIHLNRSAKLLDCGTYFPFASYYLYHKFGCEVTFCDLETRHIIVNDKVKNFRSNICYDDYGTEVYDVVLLTEVLEHLPCNMLKARDKILKSIKPDGWLLASYPLKGANAANYDEDLPGDWNTAHYTHIREFTQETAESFITGLPVVDRNVIYTTQYAGNIYQILYKKSASRDIGSNVSERMIEKCELVG